MTEKAKPRRADEFGDQQRDGQMIGNVALSESGTCPDCTTSEVDPKLVHYQKACSWASRGVLWRLDCPEAWASFERIAASCIAEGRRLSGDMLSERIRRKDYTSRRSGKVVTLNNTLVPYFVRVLLREHPELKAELRRSFFDVLFSSGKEADDAEQR